MLSDKPKFIFVDLYGREIKPATYKAPDMQGIAMPDVNGQLKVTSKPDFNDALKQCGEALL
jgi:hypothetical protein